MSEQNRDIEEGLTLSLRFKKRGGLLPVAVQESSTGKILMIASVNPDALEQTIKNGRATFWSTSRNELWEKGLTSGNRLLLDEVLVDCDQDALVYRVTLEGDGVCHTKNQNGKHRKACFYRKVDLKTKKLEFIDE
ncbi:MAG: phosphoribosyl-AMP cyclohydrolase [Balneolaceae bacterium]|nr:phosphoribosyl-AMP cyclohydrolase [Balneolaceae bacterium]MCH8547400.1 phosphoribosyl-AMP cyclohydrolase [Balneolaceae bacterium]